MEKKEFIKNAFYKSKATLLEVLTELYVKNLIADTIINNDNSIHCVEVYDNEEAREVLLKIIVDINEYNAKNDFKFDCDNANLINLSVLLNEYKKAFSVEICFEERANSFYVKNVN